MLYTTMNIRTIIRDLGFAQVPVVEIGQDFILSDMHICEDNKYNIKLNGFRLFGHGTLFSGVSVGCSLNGVPTLQPIEDLNLYMLIHGYQIFELTDCEKEKFVPKVKTIKSSDWIHLLKVSQGAIIKSAGKKLRDDKFYVIHSDKPHVRVYNTTEDFEMQYAEKGLQIPNFKEFYV